MGYNPDKLNLEVDRLKRSYAETEINAIRATVLVMDSNETPPELKQELVSRLAVLMSFAREQRETLEYFGPEEDGEDKEDDDE